MGFERLRGMAPPTRFVAECERLLAARCATKVQTERDDAEWALTFLMTMSHHGRLDEYFANRAHEESSMTPRRPDQP